MEQGAYQDAIAFMETLVGGDPPESQQILIWELCGKLSHWFPATEIERAAKFAAGRKDVYIGVGLNSKERRSNERCPANEIEGVFGLWADIDYEDGAAHKPKPNGAPLPPNEDAALELLDSLGIQPTVVIHSGHGIQAWWLFKEPLLFEKPSDRTAFAAMSRAWQQTIAAKALAKGWSVDSVHDLARILRIPGTTNAKTEPHAPVRMIDCTGKRYSDLSDFEPYFVEISPEQSAAAVASVLKPAGEARGMEYWRQVLNGTAEGNRDNAITSFNGKLLSMVADIDNNDSVTLMLEYALLVNQRNQPPLPDDDVRRSFFSVLRAEKARRAALNATEEFDTSNDGVVADEGAKDQRMAIISRLLAGGNGFPLDRVIKQGRTKSEYTLILKNGSEIAIGCILNQALVRKALLDYTAGNPNPIVVPRYKAEIWESKICTKLAAVAEEVIIPELEGRDRIDMLVATYAQSIGGDYRDHNWQDALKDRSPFIRGGELHVSPQSVLASLTRMGFKITEHELRRGMLSAGWEARQVYARVETGVGKTRPIHARYLARHLSSLGSDVQCVYEDTSEETREPGDESEAA